VQHGTRRGGVSETGRRPRGVFGQDGTRRFRQAASRFHDLGITSRIQRGLGISGTGDDHGGLWATQLAVVASLEQETVRESFPGQHNLAWRLWHRRRPQRSLGIRSSSASLGGVC
jgi:hypothetical protein